MKEITKFVDNPYDYQFLLIVGDLITEYDLKNLKMCLNKISKPSLNKFDKWFNNFLNAGSYIQTDIGLIICISECERGW